MYVVFYTCILRLITVQHQQCYNSNEQSQWEMLFLGVTTLSLDKKHST